MKTINLVFPHQLFEENPLLKEEGVFYLIEEYLFFKQYKFHKQKIAFHRASMSYYKDFHKKKGLKIEYIEASSELSDIRKLIPKLTNKGVQKINYINPTDDWLMKRLNKAAKVSGIELNEWDNPLFMNTSSDNEKYFRADKKKFFQTKFYINQRKKYNLLLEKDEKPIGGKWSFDKENRKKYPKSKQPPAIHFPEISQYHKEALEYTEQNFSNNPGELSQNIIYSIDFETSKKWLKQFLEFRFYEFGTYEDAIVSQENILNHSVLTPMLNVGLITPKYIIDETIKFADESDIPINSTEGFIRQIIGWREFIRGIYECKGVEERTSNYWNFERKIPASFYDGSTGIPPIDQTIKKVLKTGYCHHIERLMVLGNFMLLCEIHPNEVYRWFMELFIDAYDWVMVPNIYGMSQFADGGLFATKPYISSSNYILKMSDYKKGDWTKTWDALFWRFMSVHRPFFEQNPRLGLLLKTLDKMDNSKKQKNIEVAEEFFEKISLT
jgi:deoxyribodipyrimidine photolyase-related protein